MSQDVMNCLYVEAFLDFCVGRQQHISPAKHKEQYIEDRTHCVNGERMSVCYYVSIHLHPHRQSSHAVIPVTPDPKPRPSCPTSSFLTTMAPTSPSAFRTMPLPLFILLVSSVCVAARRNLTFLDSRPGNGTSLLPVSCCECPH